MRSYSPMQIPISHSPCRRRYIGPLPSCLLSLVTVLRVRKHIEAAQVYTAMCVLNGSDGSWKILILPKFLRQTVIFQNPIQGSDENESIPIKIPIVPRCPHPRDILAHAAMAMMAIFWWISCHNSTRNKKRSHSLHSVLQLQGWSVGEKSGSGPHAAVIPKTEC